MIPLFNLDIAEFTRTLQSQNGLRHGDYHRYRRFCSRKLHRLRSTLKSQCGKHKFKSAALPAKITSVKFVQLVLIQAERAWAYGLTLKSEFAIGSGTARGVIRHRYIHKFVRAARYAEELVELTKRCCDERTQVEAEAYACWMRGLANTECGKYHEALTSLTTAVAQYNRLISTSLESLFPSSAKAYRHRISDLEPIERVCKYKLRLGMVIASTSSEQVEDTVTQEISDQQPDEGFESANDMSDEGEGEVEFSDSEIEDEDSFEVMSPRKAGTAAQGGGLLDKLGGWWNKK